MALLDAQWRARWLGPFLFMAEEAKRSAEGAKYNLSRRFAGDRSMRFWRGRRGLPGELLSAALIFIWRDVRAGPGGLSSAGGRCWSARALTRSSGTPARGGPSRCALEKWLAVSASARL
jgi:hypothetical protein